MFLLITLSIYLPHGVTPMLVQQLYWSVTQIFNSEINFISYISFRAPGVVFSIVKNGELILKGGIGDADVEMEICVIAQLQCV